MFSAPADLDRLFVAYVTNNRATAGESINARFLFGYELDQRLFRETSETRLDAGNCRAHGGQPLSLRIGCTFGTKLKDRCYPGARLC